MGDGRNDDYTSDTTRMTERGGKENPQLDILLWPVALVHLDKLHLVQHMHAISYAAKYCVLAVQVLARPKGDEELMMCHGMTSAAMAEISTIASSALDMTNGGYEGRNPSAQ